MGKRAPAASKPQRRDAPETRILETATRFVQTHGARRLTIVSIAETAEMSHANVYRYFSSKAALIDAVTSAWLRPIEQEMRSIADSPDPAPDKLERILLALHRAYRLKLERDPNLFKLFVESMDNGRAPARRHRAALQAAVQRALDEGFGQSAFRRVEMRQALALVFDVSYRFMHPSAIFLDASQHQEGAESRAARTARLLLYALSSGRY